MFEIAVDPARTLIFVRIAGFLSVEDVADFARQEQAAAAEMVRAHGGYYLLVDADEAVIQSQEVVSAFGAMVMSSKHKAKRLAVVRGASLIRMQTQRILQIRDTAAIFATLAEATAWLFATDELEAAA